MRLGILVLLAVLLAPAPAKGQTPTQTYTGRVVSAVTILVEEEPSTEAVIGDLIETRIGQPLSMADVRETIAHLYSLGRFQDIQVEAVDASGGGIELRYHLIPVRAVERVQFSGDLGLSERLLRSTVTERFGRAPQLGRGAEVARVLERLYQDRGYFNASVRPGSTELRDPPRTVLTLDISAGPQARVETVEITGSAPQPRAQLLGRLRLAPGTPYERVTTQERLSQYVQRLRDRGHLQAIASHTVRLSADGRLVDVAVDIQPGPLVTVVFEGDQIPADRRAALVPFQREGSVEEDLLEDAVQRIRAYLSEQGHWRADVSVQPRELDENRLAIVFTIRAGPVYRVAPQGIQITGNASIPPEDFRPLIALAPGDLYISSRLDATTGALLRVYRTRGFAWAEVSSVEVQETDSGVDAALVRPTITIKEGPRAVIGGVTIAGTEAIGQTEIRSLIRLQPGDPYYEPAIAADEDAVQLEYLNLGFASADVQVTPSLSEDRTRVDLQFAVTEGAQTIVDHVLVVGNQRTEEEVIRREVLLRPGQPLGLRDLLESRRRLSALGLFRRIDIRELEHGPPDRRDVLITVEEAPVTTVGYGGGLEVNRRLRAGGPGGTAEERIELAPRGFFDIGRRNLGGKNRSVNLFTRVSVRPNDAPEDPERDGRGIGFSEYRVVGTYREPREFLWNADLTVTGAVEQGERSSFNFARRGVTAELLRRLTPTIRASGRYSFGATRTFDERLSLDEQAAIDRIFPQVRLSSFSGAIARDTRDDIVEPSRGAFLSVEGTVAARGLGGQVGFMKTYMQGYWFKRLPGLRQIVFASRASVGLADGFERPPLPTDPEGEAIEDLPASERFFAGGDTTIRGFALDTVGTPATISARGFPRGGNAVLILNGELRVPVWGGVGAALFVDGGNVFERVTDFAAEELRGSLGFGLRYRSPIGPIRVDLGFKMDRREFGGRREPRSVLHFSIGQAF